MRGALEIPRCDTIYFVIDTAVFISHCCCRFVVDVATMEIAFKMLVVVVVVAGVVEVVVVARLERAPLGGALPVSGSSLAVV